MLILELGTLFSLQLAYNWDKFIIVRKEIDKSLIHIKEIYGEAFYRFISKMLDYSPQLRTSFGLLLQEVEILINIESYKQKPMGIEKSPDRTHEKKIALLAESTNLLRDCMYKKNKIGQPQIEGVSPTKKSLFSLM